SPVLTSFSQPGRHSAIRFASVKKPQITSGEIPSKTNWPSIRIVSSGALDGRFQGTPRKDPRQVEPVVGRRVDVLECDDTVGRILACLLQQDRCRFLSVQSLLDLCCAKRAIPNTRDADTHIGQSAGSVQF